MGCDADHGQQAAKVDSVIWRVMASVLGERRQRLIMKHERTMNDSKHKTGILRSARRTNRFMTRDDLLVWLSLAWFVALCGAAIWVLFRPASDIFGG